MIVRNWSLYRFDAWNWCVEDKGSPDSRLYFGTDFRSALMKLHDLCLVKDAANATSIMVVVRAIDKARDEIIAAMKEVLSDKYVEKTA